MGGCFSDVKGGRQAIGGEASPTSFGGVNDAVDQFYKGRGFQPLYIPVEMSLSAKDLRDRDIMSKSDAMAVVYIKKRNGTLEEIGRTDVILNSLSPCWIKKISINYQFEMVQPLLFQVYDIDTSFHNMPHKEIDLRKQDFLGQAECYLSEIVTQRDWSLTLKLNNKNVNDRSRNLGSLTVQAEQSVTSRTVVEIVFRCTKLANKDLFSKTDPFLRISKIVENGRFIPICRTEVVQDNLNPTWNPVTLSTSLFGSKENPLVIECFDFDSSGDHAFIGKVQKSMADLERLHRDQVGVNFIKPHRGHEKVLKGKLFVKSFVEREVHTFLDYMSSGFELNFMVAVDFTASNGNPRSRDSRHYIDPSGYLNAYQKAIKDVGEVLLFYDSDRLFPSWGFGGRLADGSISHCFNLNGNPHGDEVAGVEGIMAAYTSALHNVALAGPTLFSRVIEKASNIAARSFSANKHNYFVLLIITDGILTDIQETKDAIVKACDFPLSILIVGVGNEDFTQMKVLDADDGPRLVSSTGQVAPRDIVQFVPMRHVQHDEVSIVQALLEELPGQFLTFMKNHNIKPLNASTRS